MKTLSTEVDNLKLEVAEMQVQMKRVWRRRMRNEWCAEKFTYEQNSIVSLQELYSLQQCVCSYMFCNWQSSCVGVLFWAYSRCVAFAVWHSLCGIRCVARLLCLRAFAEHVGALCCRWQIRCFASSFAVAICACSACIDLSDLLLQCVFVMACCYWCVLCVYFACSCLSDILLQRMFFMAIVVTAAVFGESAFEFAWSVSVFGFDVTVVRFCCWTESTRGAHGKSVLYHFQLRDDEAHSCVTRCSGSWPGFTPSICSGSRRKPSFTLSMCSGAQRTGEHSHWCSATRSRRDRSVSMLLCVFDIF